jgi:hypothetical protein
MHECARLNCHDFLWITGAEEYNMHKATKLQSMSVDHLEVAKDATRYN